MDFNPEVVERISLKIEEKGVTVDREKVVSKLKLLVSEFGIPVEEAERTVTNELMREYNLTGPGSQSGNDSELKEISDCQPDDWVTVEAKVVSLSIPPSTAIAQKGIIDDGSGAIEFVVWEKAKANVPELEERKWYRFESAVIDEFRGAPNMKIHSGTKITFIDEDRPLIPTIAQIADLKPGVASVRVKVMQDWETRHDQMEQTGIVADETGTIKFVTWKNNNQERLELDKVYTLYYTTVNEYQGRLSLNLTNAMIMREDGADIEVASGNASVTGAFVHMGSGSGLIKRCKVEGCNRALSRQNYCPQHEIQSEFRYDLRITGVVDDGQKATNVLIQREETEKLSGITLDKAIEIAENNPLGLDDVFLKMQTNVMGRYVTCKGNDIDGTILVKDIEIMKFNSERHASLLNRVGESLGGAE